MERQNIVVAIPPVLRDRLFRPSSWSELTRLGEVACSPSPESWTTPRAAALLATADVLVTGWGSAMLADSVLPPTSTLRAVVHTGGSVRSVFPPTAYARGIRVSSQAAANALPVAEYTLATILLMLKGGFRARDRYHAARSGVDTAELLANDGVYERRVGVVGASKIGRRVIELLAPFDVELVLADPFLADEEARALGARKVSLRELMSTSDLVTLHAPLLPTTEGMIDAPLLASLRDGAIFVNTARGGLVDEHALLAELSTGRIEAVIDVTDPEVPPTDSPWWSLPNVVLTPHIAGALGRELWRMGDGAVAEVGRVARGEPLEQEILPEGYERLA